MKKIRNRLAGLALAGVLLGGVGVAASEVAEPAVNEAAQSVGIDLPIVEEAAHAASASVKVSCYHTARWPSITVSKLGTANINVQVWDYSGTTYLAAATFTTSTGTWHYYGRDAVQFRIYSTGGFTYSAGCRG
jgi:hypothetical protein